LSLIAAVVFAVLLVGSMLALFQLRTMSHPSSETEQPQLYATVGNTVYRIDPTTHKTLWHFQMPLPAGSTYTYLNTSSPAGSIDFQSHSGYVVNGIYYMIGIGGGSYYLYALNTSDGSVRWHFQWSITTNNVMFATNELIINNAVYIEQWEESVDYSQIVALDASTGKQLWQHRYEWRPASTNKSNKFTVLGMQLQAATNDTLYVTNGFAGTADGWTRSALSTKDGSVIWQYNTNVNEMPLAAKISDGTLYIITAHFNNSPGHLYTYDATQGKEKSVVTFSFSTRAKLMISPIVSNGVIYLTVMHPPFTANGTLRETVYALRAKDGTQLWHYDIQQGVAELYGIKDDTLYIVFAQKTDKKDIVAINAVTGQALWSHPVPADITSMIGSTKSYDNMTGSIIAYYNLPLLAMSKDFVYLNTRGNKIYVLRTSDGSFVTSFTIGEKPPAGLSDVPELVIGP
ncbi:MAG TPA: PQQ-binding-like beta-propeller repeat protein, partial [Ktedonobacteraceae bacterium]|nr:PQQ-binding-like beta-propeller repeat protein [Ktedonobacteraceae bacterium]